MNPILLLAVVWTTLLLQWTWSQSVAAQDIRRGTPTRIIPRVGASLPLDLVFQDETGSDVRLRDYFAGKPVVLVPVYYKCPMLCGLELKGLVQCLRAMNKTVGKDFEVIAFSFDPKEPFTLAAQKRRHYVHTYGRGNSIEGWHFLTSSSESSRALCDSIGFQTAYDRTSGQYAHAACIVVISPQGTITRYHYGVDFVPAEMNLSLVEASEGRLGSITDQVQLLCFAFDPATGKYGLAILRISQLAGALTAITILAYIGIRIWLERHQPAAHSATGEAA